MTDRSVQNLFKNKIANYLKINSGHIFLFWKGRVALYAILKAIGIKEGDEIILPAFTCVVAVNPIIYLGAKPVYVDIDPKTYNVNPNKIEEKITPKTKAILAQNTFGLSADLDAICEIAKKYNLYVIEDCAHGFGGFYKGKLNGTIADAAFFSTQWNKPFSTGLGGIAVVKEGQWVNGAMGKWVIEKLKQMEENFIKPSLKDILQLKTLIFLREHFLNSNTYWFALKTYRWLSKHNLILGSSQGKELERPIKPKDFEKGFSEVQAKKGIEELMGKCVNGLMRKRVDGCRGRKGWKIDKVIEHRKKVADMYKNILKDLDIEPPYEPEYAVHTYLKFPLLVKDRKKIFKEAEKERIELGDWFISPIHPITKNLEYWHYKWGENPIAEKISQHIVNLPTHTKISEDYVAHIAQFLRKNRDNIYSSFEEIVK
ncbi:MAG TPA: aminotransferase class I/II-fold pyridoxal phosphate-dependent enzyme [Candidatus Atribacteria bacterium]|nr:aminotransferase class I/II-fold pyridoxal phosphate-dependent enzyme [Candidatus Atribacteria bacterium]